MSWVTLAVEAVTGIVTLIADSVTLTESAALERLERIIAEASMKMIDMRASMKAAQDAGDKLLNERFPGDDEITKP